MLTLGLLIPLGQNDCHFEDDIFKSIFVNDFSILNKTSMKFVFNGMIDDNSALA